MPTTPSAPALSYTVSGTGPPTLLVMGFAMRGRVWAPTARHLRDLTVCTYDHRDVGDSARTPWPYTMTDLADDARRVLDAAGWSDAHVVGVSMGGMIAQELALTAPERVRSLTLIATQPGGPRAWVPPLGTLPALAVISLGRRRLNRPLMDWVLHPPHRLRGIAPADRRQRWEDADGHPIPTAVRRRQLMAIRTHDTRDRLGSLRIPTQVVKPLHDRLCDPSHSDRLAAAIPGATLVEMDAGHGLLFHASVELAGHIRRFIARCEAAHPTG
jgi:pimeloyl-ACP methyl ester carboxylesterase